MLFNEPKLLKSHSDARGAISGGCFSALQRAEIAEMHPRAREARKIVCFSALQRAEIAEIWRQPQSARARYGFSALQRAEIAEIAQLDAVLLFVVAVSVLFNEPKLLKWRADAVRPTRCRRFSALQRAEIAEIGIVKRRAASTTDWFQCSSTSRNC